VLPYIRIPDCPRWILKMHGCITHPEDIVITRYIIKNNKTTTTKNQKKNNKTTNKKKIYKNQNKKRGNKIETNKNKIHYT
jgi:hypothetical protein